MRGRASLESRANKLRVPPATAGLPGRGDQMWQMAKKKNNNGSNGSSTSAPTMGHSSVLPEQQQHQQGGRRPYRDLIKRPDSFTQLLARVPPAFPWKNRSTGERRVKKGGEQERKVISNARSKASKMKTKTV